MQKKSKLARISTFSLATMLFLGGFANVRADDDRDEISEKLSEYQDHLAEKQREAEESDEDKNEDEDEKEYSAPKTAPAPEPAATTTTTIAPVQQFSAAKQVSSETQQVSQPKTSGTVPQTAVPSNQITTVSTVVNDSDGDGLFDDEDPHPYIAEIYIANDGNQNGLVDSLDSIIAMQ
jgi:hypothetical protein